MGRRGSDGTVPIEEGINGQDIILKWTIIIPKEGCVEIRNVDKKHSGQYNYIYTLDTIKIGVKYSYAKKPRVEIKAGEACFGCTIPAHQKE